MSGLLEGKVVVISGVGPALGTTLARRCAENGADLVLAMTSAHRRELLRRAERLGVDADRIRMFRELDPAVAGDERHWAAVGARTHHGLDVPDPWYGGHQDFLDTLEVIERVTPQILALVR